MCLIQHLVFVMALMAMVGSKTAPDSPPWAKEPEYFRALEHGFRLDATHHHIHFVDRGELFLFQRNICHYFVTLLTRFRTNHVTDSLF